MPDLIKKFLRLRWRRLGVSVVNRSRTPADRQPEPPLTGNLESRLDAAESPDGGLSVATYGFGGELVFAGVRHNCVIDKSLVMLY